MSERLLHFQVAEDEQGRTVRDLLQSTYGVSRRLLNRAKYDGEILINGEPVRVTRIVEAGDVVEVILPSEQPETIQPQPMPLAIRYEDRDLLLIAKPAGMVVHPTRTHPDRTLANAVVAYWREKGEMRRFRPVNRLDKDTSGLLIIAKNQWAHEGFARMQRERTLRRTYLAVVHGLLNQETGEIAAPIGLRPGSIIEREVRTDGQPALTRYRVLSRGAEMSVVELQLLTGRTHQIRVHMRHIGHPLVGDDLYGGQRSLIGRQALHAARLAFSHPRTGQLLCFEEPLPADMAELVKKCTMNR
ncbi:RluA family pseudouridine synthase [Brevibacillus humidisoli]|uniref:RluA family pseudouridine synthase n=1 Tax=Brevibacillus humidisoli TaxID=2895522 RepID=UPI001E51480F|nr:RluA family pseudouridine synthase [Brevibacillus humidisoli]UFJ41630.1 RluA family pseudouridine synthase [Brevibacillus humidisoli]